MTDKNGSMPASLTEGREGFVVSSCGDYDVTYRIIIGEDPDPNREAYSATAEHFFNFEEALDHFKVLQKTHPSTCMRLLSGEPELDIDDVWEVDRDHLAMIERQQDDNYKDLTYYTLRIGGVPQGEACRLVGLTEIPLKRKADL